MMKNFAIALVVVFAFLLLASAFGSIEDAEIEMQNYSRANP